MACLQELLQEPIHEGRDQGEEDPRVAWLKTLEEFAWIDRRDRHIIGASGWIARRSRRKIARRDSHIVGAS